MAQYGKNPDGTVSECKAEPQNRGKGRCHHAEHVDLTPSQAQEINEKATAAKMKSAAPQLSKPEAKTPVTREETFTVDGEKVKLAPKMSSEDFSNLLCTVEDYVNDEKTKPLFDRIMEKNEAVYDDNDLEYADWQYEGPTSYFNGGSSYSAYGRSQSESPASEESAVIKVYDDEYVLREKTYTRMVDENGEEIGEPEVTYDSGPLEATLDEEDIKDLRGILTDLQNNPNL